MSLINKVINDLEDRQAFVTSNEGKIFYGLASADNPEHKRKILNINLFITVLFLAVCVSASYAFIERRTEIGLQEIEIVSEQNIVSVKSSKTERVISSSDITSKEEHLSFTGYEQEDLANYSNSLKLDFSLPIKKAAKTLSEVPESVIPIEAGISISSVKLEEINNQLLLSFKLTSDTQYRAYSLENPDRVVVEIDNAEFHGILPDPTLTRGIRNIRWNKSYSDKFIFVMDTMAPYTVDEINLNSYSDGYALTLSMANSVDEGPRIPSDIALEELRTREPVSPVNAQFGDMTKSVASKDSARTTYINAQGLYRAGKFNEANELLDNLINIYPDYNPGRTLLVQKLIKQGQLVKAEHLLKSGLERDSKEAIWADLYARLLVNKGKIDAAIVVLTSMTPDIWEEPDYFAFLAALYQKVQRHDDAINTYHEVLQIKPEKSVWWMGLAISLEAVDKYGEALEAYRRASRGNGMSQDLKKYVHSKISYLNGRG